MPKIARLSNISSQRPRSAGSVTTHTWVRLWLWRVIILLPPARVTLEENCLKTPNPPAIPAARRSLPSARRIPDSPHHDPAPTRTSPSHFSGLSALTSPTPSPTRGLASARVRTGQNSPTQLVAPTGPAWPPESQLPKLPGDEDVTHFSPARSPRVRGPRLIDFRQAKAIDPSQRTGASARKFKRQRFDSGASASDWDLETWIGFAVSSYGNRYLLCSGLTSS